MHAVAAAVDRRLGELNIEYHAKRESGRLRHSMPVASGEGPADAYKVACVRAANAKASSSLAVLQYRKDLCDVIRRSTTDDSRAHARGAADSLQGGIPSCVGEPRRDLQSLGGGHHRVRRAGTRGVCPRPYVTGETVDTARAFFERHDAAIKREVVDLEACAPGPRSRSDLDANPAAWCAIELAMLDFRSRGRTDDRAVPVAAGARRPLSLHGRSGRPGWRRISRQRGAVPAIRFSGLQGEAVGRSRRDREKSPSCASGASRSACERMPTTSGTRGRGGRVPARSRLSVLRNRRTDSTESVRRTGAMADALDCPIVLDESFLRRRRSSQLDGSARLAG